MVALTRTGLTEQELRRRLSQRQRDFLMSSAPGAGGPVGGPSGGGGGGPVAVAGDLIDVTFVDASAIPTAPANNVNATGYVGRFRFKSWAIGQTGVASRFSVTYYEPGYVNGVATPIQRTAVGMTFLRKPYPQWTSGQAYGIGQLVSSRPGTSANTTRIYHPNANNSGGLSTVRPVNTSGTSGLLADSYNWTHDSPTTQSDNPPKAFMETVDSGVNAEVYVVFNRYISSAANTFTVAVAANAYGASNASNAALFSVTNASSFAPFKPHCGFVMEPWTLKTGTIRAEVYADHPYGKNGRTLDSVAFKVLDNAGAQIGSDILVSAMSQSLNAPVTVGNALPVFGATIDLAAMGVADGLKGSIAYVAYPNIGGAFDSRTDGFGPMSAWTVATKLAGNHQRAIPFTKNAAAVVRYAVVGAAAGATPSVSTDPATADLATNRFGSIFAAAGALQTANSGVLDASCIIYLRPDGAALSLTGPGGDLNTKTYSTTALQVIKWPGDTGTVTLNSDATAANRHSGIRSAWEGIAMPAAAAAPVIDNSIAGGIRDFPNEIILRNCAISGNVGQQALGRFGLAWAFGCQLVGNAILLGSSNASAVHALYGCSVNGGAPITVNAYGCKLTNGATLGDMQTAVGNWNENSQKIATHIFAYCSWYNCTVNVAAFTRELTEGGSWSGNLIESNNAAAKGGQLSADGVTVPCGRLYILFNTSAGDGMNVTYQDIGNLRVMKTAILIGNVSPDRNMKADLLDTDTTYGAFPDRTGNWGPRHAVEFDMNVVFTPTNPLPASPSSFVCEVAESGGVFAGTPNWTLDKSKTGAGGGNGNYQPTASGLFCGRVPVGRQFFPFDQNSVARLNDGTGATGGLEHA